MPVVVVLVAGSHAASAEPRFEASGFVGLGVFTANTELGNSWAPEQVPNTAPVFGGRLGWLAVPVLAELPRDLHLALGVEGELSFATAFTGQSAVVDNFSRMSYFAPVFGWRAHGLLRLAGLHAIEPHLALGVGGETVESTSPFMAKETDPVVYWGGGASVEIAGRWRLRVDLRHGVMPGRDGVTSTFEAQLGVAATLGEQPAAATHAAPPTPPAIDPDKDTDGDGFTDQVDVCPTEPETVNGVDDADGCPDHVVDRDHDGILDVNDKCPDVPEDVDHFEDTDGCPETDNDGDGIIDANDKCPLEAETVNAYEDTDGCPDEIPVGLARALEIGSKLRFERRRARVTPYVKRLLKDVRAALVAYPDAKIAITGHPGTDANADLVKRRAEAVKWYLVDQGIPMARIWTALGDPSAKGKPSSIELSLRAH